MLYLDTYLFIILTFNNFIFFLFAGFPFSI